MIPLSFSGSRHLSWRHASLLLLVSSSVLAEGAPAPSLPRFTHPGAGQTFYLVMPDRFANGRTDNDTGQIQGGPEQHGFDPTRISHYHGGDLAGLTARLDYIHALGTTAIWTTPPFKNHPVQGETASYHGYWPVDFLNIDPHLGTNDEYRAFIREAHARGMRVYLDAIVNHTADIIGYASGDYSYVDTKSGPYRDTAGRSFDIRAVADNGIGREAPFPQLSADRSFPYIPIVPQDKARIKNPAWLNDVTLYHNRGNTSFQGESSVLGDFVGLDDTMNEHPRVVAGFIDIFSSWLDWGIDGFRIDTMRHVNTAFWQAFNPALRARARELGRPDFLQFGEVMNETGDTAYLSEFSTGTMPADSTTDFSFATAARYYVSQGGPAAGMIDFLARDDYYTDHDSNVHSSVTLLGNYDLGRWAYFLTLDNPGASPELLGSLVRLGYGLLYFSRGMPVLYYGDEQGMIGRGGWDMQAREDMFPSRAPDFRRATLLGTTRTGADDKFDPQHPFYRLFVSLGRLRREHVALRTGAMIPRATHEPNVFAFSRIDRAEKVEYLAVFNNSRTRSLRVTVPTSQPAGAGFRRIFDSISPEEVSAAVAAVNRDGALSVEVPPLQFSLWRAETPLRPASAAPRIALVNPAEGAALKFSAREVDNLVFPSRQEIRAEVEQSDGVAEVTFLLARSSRPDEYAVIGVDDAPPYRVFWSPPADLAPDESLAFIATVNDLRGRLASARIGGVTLAPTAVEFGIRHAKSPHFIQPLPPHVQVNEGAPLTLNARAEGSGALEYQWFRDDQPIAGANAPTMLLNRVTAADSGCYRVAVHNLAGTTLSAGTIVTVR